MKYTVLLTVETDNFDNDYATVQRSSTLERRAETDDLGRAIDEYTLTVRTWGEIEQTAAKKKKPIIGTEEVTIRLINNNTCETISRTYYTVDKH